MIENFLCPGVSLVKTSTNPFFSNVIVLTPSVTGFTQCQHRDKVQGRTDVCPTLRGAKCSGRRENTRTSPL